MKDSEAIEITPTGSIPFRRIAHVLFVDYPKRTLVGLTMMITQSFLYNAIFFTYVLVLENFFKIPQDQTPYYFFPFAIGNLVGPLVLGRFFDSWGRRQMIFLTYGLAGVVLAVSAFLFSVGAMNAPLQVTFWCVAFFFASAGASSAYLTVSEIFPLEIRSQAISYFFAVAQIFGALGPIIFGTLVGDGKARGPLVVGDYVGAGVMIVGGVVALIFGVDAARKGLEAVTSPLSVVGSDTKK